MGLPKGVTNNPAGRPKGSVNKVGADLRERITAFIADNWERVEEDFDILDPKDRLHFLEKLLAYALPKLQNVKHEGDVGGETARHIIIIDDMSTPPGG
jgi:hypothetical protein